ncbi:MAG: urease accessory protein UreF [Flavobacteriaceae bacterium]
MTDTAAFIRIMTWMSPSFPVGSFNFSGGLEQAVAEGLVHNTQSLRDWIADVMTLGSSWNDAVLFAAAWREAAEGRIPREVNALALAGAGSAERHAETMAQGRAFIEAARAWPNPVVEKLANPIAYPVAVGAVAGSWGIGLPMALAAWLNTYAGNLVQAAIRLSVTGQEGGVAIMASLEAVAAETAERAATSTLDDLGNSAILADIVSMKHETLEPRLFRS